MTFSSKLAIQVLAVAKAPITAASFAGDDIRYAAEYEVLEQELGKAASLHAAGTVDWEAVREGSERLLSTQTKDLRIAAWLTWGLYQRDSFLGLHAGLAVLGFLCRNHWEDVHPRKDRTRAAAVTWLVPRMEQVLADHVPMGEQLPLFEQIALELRGLESCLATHLGAQAPLLLPLCRRLEEMVKRAGAAHPQPSPVGAAIAQVKQAAAQVFTATTPVEHEKDAHKSLRSLQDQGRPLCSWWLKQKATDLKPLRLARTLLWLSIDSLPERNTEQITTLRGITYGQHIGLQAGTDRTGAQRYAIHVHAELEEGDFKRYIADMVNGTLNPDDAKPDVAAGDKSTAKGDWCYPYTPSAGHSLQHLTALSKAKAGFYPIGGNGLWHGGIHLDKGTSEAFDQSRINCMTHGEVVAYRVDEDYPVSTYAGRPPLQIRAPFSTGFVLVRHTLQPKAPATADESKPKPPALTIYSLYMHLKCWKDYRQDEKLERPAFWGSGIYTVNTRSGELNVRAEARGNASIVGKLSKGTQIRASGEGAFLKLEQVISGNNEPALTPGKDGSLPGYVSSSYLTAQSQPKTVGAVVLLDPPVPIKAGDLIGHVGKYQNQSDGSPQDLLHLEVFSCEDVPTFISESRTWAQNLPEKEKTLLKVHAGASKLVPHRDDIKAGNPPKLTDEGAEIGVDLILPQNLLDALPAEAKIKIPASNTATGCSPETNWWRLDDLLADKDGQPINGWLAEQELITTRHSPWEWEGFDFLEDTDTPSSGLAYYLNAARSLSDDEKTSYQGAIDQSDKGPVRSRLYDIIDTNRDGKMTSEEIQAAPAKPWHAQSISQLVTQHESEWFWNASRWTNSMI